MDNFHFEIAIGLGANGGQIDIGNISNLVRGEVLGGLEDLVRDALGGRCTIREVLLDAKILVRSWDIVSTDQGEVVFTYHQDCGWQSRGYHQWHPVS